MGIPTIRQIGELLPLLPVASICKDLWLLGEVNVELDSGTIKLREKLSQEEDSKEKALEEFNATLDNVLEKLSQEKDSLDDLYGFLYDTDDDACISGKLKREDQARGLEVPKKR
ncbi:hypothetical protein Tco_1040028 [Tanacetum coccineum]